MPALQASLTMPVLLAYGIIACLISDVLLVTTDGEDQHVNLALHKPVYAFGKWTHCLVDGKYRTTISPFKSTFPAVVVDLQDVYNLSSIHLHAQNEWSFGNAGINVSFSVYIWDKPTCRCEFEKYHPWTPVQKNLFFKQKGQEIVLNGPYEAQYVIVMPDFPNFDDRLETHDGMAMGELRAFGEKIRDGFKPIPPEDGTHSPSALEIRNELLQGQGSFYTEFRRMNFRQNPEHDDIALAWHRDRLGMMVSRREKARIISTFGIAPLKRLLNGSDHAPMRNNFLRWLSNQSKGSRFVNVSEGYSPGDVLVITPFDQFDVDQVYNDLIQGNNSALVAHTNEPGKTAEYLPKLLGKLKILVEYADINYMPMDFNAKWFIDNNRDVPIDYEFQVALNSWQQFRTRKLAFGYLSEAQLESPQIQGILHKVLKKYESFFAHYAACRYAAYMKNPETDIALRNYNEMLLLQRGTEIVTAPGAFSTPGGITSNLKPSNYTVRYKIDVAGKYFPTGGYAAPGEPFEYKVLDYSGGNIGAFQIHINPQVDDVFHRPSMVRWPRVWLRQTLKMKGQMVSPFGGPIVISAPANSTLIIRFKNVYRYPFFNIRDRNATKNWESEKQKYKGTPYGMIMGDNMISMLETPALLRMNATTIEWSTRYFDNIVKMMHNYRGTKHEHARMEVFVTDDEISAGYGHAGYPWMAYREWANSYDAIEDIKRGRNIGYPHEIGHNLQVYKVTFKDGVEVTNNMYIPVVHKYLLNLSSYSKGASPGWSDGDEKNLIENWNSGQYRGVQVSYYNYFGRLFSPALVGNVLSLGVHTKENLDTEQRKIDFWIQNMCTESGYDLVPFHRLWHFPISQATVDLCSKYKCVFPNDELTAKVPKLVNEILRDYGKKCLRDKPRDVQFKRDIMRGINQMKPQSIFITDN